MNLRWSEYKFKYILFYTEKLLNFHATSLELLVLLL